MGDTPEPKKVAWNASQGIIMEISNRRVSANGFFINNRIKNAMNSLIAIKQSVIQSMLEDERKKLKDIEDKFTKISGALSKNMAISFDNKNRELYNLANTLAKKIYSEYNDLLMDLLESRGYLIGEQSDGSQMKF